jgi:hypothetical protein
MQIKLTLPDELFEVYAEEGVARKMSLEPLLLERLEKGIPLDPRERPMILSGRTREQIEQFLGGGHLKGEVDLLQKVKRLANIRFGEHELRLTAGQMEEMTWMANKQSRSIDQVLKAAWDDFCGKFFEFVGK